MPIRRTPGMNILLHFYWPVADGALSPDARVKLASYISRYAETLNIRVHSVGGLADHLHILADLPTNMAIDQVGKELLPPTARYLRDVMNQRNFTWDSAGITVVSISPWDKEHIAEYIADQEARHATGELESALERVGTVSEEVVATTGDELPAWLTDALRK